jgi:sugar lactone lactonase YvrE
MQESRFPHFIFAVLAVGVGIFCLRTAYLKLTAEGLERALPLPAAILAVCGLVCAIGGLALLIRHSGQARQDQPARQPLFGRDAKTPGSTRSLLGPAVVVFLLAAFATLAVDGLGSWPTGEQRLEALQGSGEPETAEEPPGDVAQAPKPAQAPEPAEPVVPPGLTLPAGPPVMTTETREVPVEPDAPEVALAPAPEPPQTTAPLPQTEALPTQAVGHRDAVVWLSLSPDGKTFLTASTDHTIKHWDFAGRKLIKTLGSQKDMARSALFLPDGRTALTAGDDGEIVLRSVDDGALLHVFSAKDHGGVNKIAISADGRRMISGHDRGTVILWDLETKAALHALDAHGWSVAGVAMSPDGKTAVSGDIDGELKLWDVDSGRLIRSWLGHERGSYGIAFTPDGNRLVTGSGDRTIKLWDLEKGREIRRFDGHSGTVYAIVLSADGTQILSASLDGTARLWNLETGDEIAQYIGHRGPVYAVAFGPDGTVITGGKDRSIRIWPGRGGPAVAMLPGAPASGAQ